MTKSAFDDLCIVTWRDGKSMTAYFNEAEGYLRQGCTIRPANADEQAEHAAYLRRMAAALEAAGSTE